MLHECTVTWAAAHFGSTFVLCETCLHSLDSNANLLDCSTVRFFISPLTSVNLLRNDIGDGAAAVIAAAEQNGKIKTLCGIKPDQTEANFRGWGLQPADAQLLAFDLKFSSPLTSVNLLKNDIGDGAAAVIAAAEQNGKIKTLCGIEPDQTEANFYYDNLKSADAQLFAFDLKFSSPLTSVNLLRNDLGDGAAAVIAAAEQNGKIKTLCGIKPDQTEAEFSEWGLKPADAQLLAFDLKFSSPLKQLNISYNSIGKEGAAALAAVLPSR